MKTRREIYIYLNFQHHFAHCRNLMPASCSPVLLLSVASRVSPVHWLRTWLPGFFPTPNLVGVLSYDHNIPNALAQSSLLISPPGTSSSSILPLSHSGLCHQPQLLYLFYHNSLHLLIPTAHPSNSLLVPDVHCDFRETACHLLLPLSLSPQMMPE